MNGFLNPRLASLFCLALATCTLATSTLAQEPAGGTEKPTDLQAADLQAADRAMSPDRAKIEVAIKSYVAAFNSQDVDKLVALWANDGIYVSRTSGDQITGHDALRKEFTEILSGDAVPRLTVETESIEFISPNVAVERGTAQVTSASGNEETTYRVIYIERHGKWLIDRVSEDAISDKVSNYEQLKELEFLVGEWVFEDDSMSIEINGAWTKNQNYLSRTYRVWIDGQIESSGLQIIGWDAKNSQIRSWLFDSDGGFIKGEWNRRDDEWVVQSVATLADGASGSSTEIYRPTDSDSFTWQKRNRVIAGKLLPNTEQVKLSRR